MNNVPEKLKEILLESRSPLIVLREFQDKAD